MEEDKTLKNIMDDDFAKIILKIRKEHNLTQKELADLINVSDRTISKWENGQSVPDLICVKNICKALNISPSSLVLDKKSKKEHFIYTINKVHNFFTLKRIIAFIFTITFILLLLFYINNRNTVTIYKLKLSSDNFYIREGYIINTKYKNIVVINDLKLNNNIEYETIKVDVYTIINGDEVIIYSRNDLENIYIDEFNENNYDKRNDIIKNITHDLFIKLTINSTNKQNIIYNEKIYIVEKYQNNKIISRDIPSDNRVINVIDNNSIVNNELLKLGYEYDNKRDNYQKELDNYQITIDTNNKKIIMNENNKYKVILNYENYSVEYNEYNTSGKRIVQLKKGNNESICLLGKCKDNYSIIDEVVNSYNELKDIL